MYDNADPDVYAERFADSKLVGARYLAFRELPQLIEKYVRGTTALDYGCGPGISTRFLKSHGLRVNGVDISKQMIRKAKERDPEGSYELIKNGEIYQAADQQYDLVLANGIFNYIGSKEEIVKCLTELARVLKPDGCLIAIVSSDTFYNQDWLTINSQFPENENAVSGQPVRMFMKDLNMVLHQYLWTESDYRDVCDASGLAIVEIVRPLGRDGEGFEWGLEKELPCIIYFVARKKNYANNTAPVGSLP